MLSFAFHLEFSCGWNHCALQSELLSSST